VRALDTSKARAAAVRDLGGIASPQSVPTTR
jgi:hypothetical protein